METAARLRRQYILAVLQHDCIQIDIALHTYIQARTRTVEVKQMVYISVRHVIDSNIHTIRSARREHAQHVERPLTFVNIRFAFALARYYVATHTL